MSPQEAKFDKADHPWEWFTSVAGIGMAHNFYVHHLFSKVMDENDIGQIVELGTYKGSMSVMLGLEGIRKQVPVYSFDISDQTTLETSRLFTTLSIKYHIMDIFEPDNRRFLEDQLSKRKTFLICDNGRKAEEFEAFGRHLPSGSVIAAHDYLTEFHDKDVEPIAHKLEPYLKDEWNRHNCQFTMYRVK